MALWLASRQLEYQWDRNKIFLCSQLVRAIYMILNSELHCNIQTELTSSDPQGHWQ